MKRSGEIIQNESQKKHKSQIDADSSNPSFVGRITKDVALSYIAPYLGFKDVLVMERVSKLDKEFWRSDEY